MSVTITRKRHLTVDLIALTSAASATVAETDEGGNGTVHINIPPQDYWYLEDVNELIETLQKVIKLKMVKSGQ